MPWSVSVLVRVSAATLDNDTLIALADAVEEERDWTLARWPLDAGFCVMARSHSKSITEAATSVHDEVAGWLSSLDIPTSIVSVRAVDMDVYEMELDRSVDTLFGVLPG